MPLWRGLEVKTMKLGINRYCDCCGVLLTKKNNKCGYELCDKCNEGLEFKVRQSKKEVKNDSI